MPLFFLNFSSLVPKIEICLKHFLDKISKCSHSVVAAQGSFLSKIYGGGPAVAVVNALIFKLCSAAMPRPQEAEATTAVPIRRHPPRPMHCTLLVFINVNID